MANVVHVIGTGTRSETATRTGRRIPRRRVTRPHSVVHRSSAGEAPRVVATGAFRILKFIDMRLESVVVATAASGAGGSLSCGAGGAAASSAGVAAILQERSVPPPWRAAHEAVRNG